MKRVIIGLIFLVLISNFVFAEDYIVDDSGIQTNPSITTNSIEIARLKADLENLTFEIQKLQESNAKLLSKQDVNGMKKEVLIEVEGLLNYFLAQLLLMFFAVIVFFFASAFIMKAKKWL